MALALPSYGEVLAQVSLHPGVIAAAAAGIGLVWAGGRAVLRRAGAAETAAAGMGLYALLQTGLGVFAVDLRLGVAAFVLLAMTALVRGRWDSSPAAMAKALILLLPLLLLLSGRIGSEWDEFSHWLRAFRYLAVNHVLPGGPQVPEFEGCCGAYPYAWPMVGYLASLLSGFSEALPALINVLILGLSGLLLADITRRELGSVSLSWIAVAVGLLGATAAGPAFVAKLAFSSYSDIVTGFLVAVLVVLGEGLAAERDDGDGAWRQGIGVGLAGAALMAVKPGNAGLFVCSLAGLLLVSLRVRGWRGVLRLELLPVVLLPMGIAALWRWHVGKYLVGQELVIRPLDQWNLAESWAILAGMVEVASQKSGHFGLGLLAVFLGIRGFGRCNTRFGRLCVMVAVLFLGYNLFLFSTYVAVFNRNDAMRVASFWRYNTHLGLAVVLPAALLMAVLVRRFQESRWLRPAGRAALVLTVLGPLAALPHVRFDVDAQKHWMRTQLHDLLARIPAGEEVAVFDSLGTGLSGVVATYEWDRRLRLGAIYTGFHSQDPVEWRDTMEPRWLVILSGRERLLGSAAPEGVVLHRDQGGWTEVARLAYPGNTYPRQYP